MPEQPTPIDLEWQEWRRSVDEALDAEHRAPQLLPDLAYPFAPYGGAAGPSSLWYIPVTNGAFDGSQASQPWLGRMTRCVHKSLLVRVPWTTDGGTTGEVRLFTSPNATSAVALPAASSGIVTFNWLHGITPWLAADFGVFVEARRTGGAGGVNIGYPLGGVIQRDPRGATVTGI